MGARKVEVEVSFTHNWTSPTSLSGRLSRTTSLLYQAARPPDKACKWGEVSGEVTVVDWKASWRSMLLGRRTWVRKQAIGKLPRLGMKSEKHEFAKRPAVHMEMAIATLADKLSAHETRTDCRKVA